MIGNIDSQINDRMQMYSGNPQALQQRYAQTQELVDLLALQKMKNDRAAATSAVQGAMQTSSNTVRDKLEQEAMQGSRNDVMRSMAPGIQQQGQQMAQMQNRAAMGLPTQSASNMNRMANGGIVGYSPGGDVNTPPVPTPGAVPPKAVDREDIKTLAGLYRNAQARISAATDPRAKSTEQQALDDLKMQMGDQLPYVMQYLDSTKGMMQPRTNGMANGGIVGYAGGGGVGNNPSVDIEALLDAVMMAESGGDPNAVSRAGAEGLYQIMPSTARQPGFGVKPIDNSFDPQESRRFARDYLQAMLNRYDGDVEAALIAYNAGFGNADKFVASGRNMDDLPQPGQTKPYVRKVMDDMRPVRTLDFAGGRQRTTQEPEGYTQRMRREKLERNEAGIAALRSPEVAVEGPAEPPAFQIGGLGYLQNIGRQQQARRDDFGQAFPEARGEVAQYADDKEQGAVASLRRVGEQQDDQRAKDSEIVKFLRMQQDSQDMVNAADPAANIKGYNGEQQDDQRAKASEIVKFLRMQQDSQNMVNAADPAANIKGYNGEDGSFIDTLGNMQRSAYEATKDYMPDFGDLVGRQLEAADANPLNYAANVILSVYGGGTLINGGTKILGPIIKKYGPAAFQRAKDLALRATTKPNPNLTQGPGFTMRSPGTRARVADPVKLGVGTGLAIKAGDALYEGEEVPDVMSGLNDMPQPSDAQKFANLFPDAQTAVDQYADDKDNRSVEDEGSNIDFRALREFLAGGAGQTSTAGALAEGARGLGAYQAAEQGRLDKINEAALGVQLKRDLAVNESIMLDRKLLAEYEIKLSVEQLKIAKEILGQLDDPLSISGLEYQAKANVIREQYEREPEVMGEALRRLRDGYVQQGIKTVRQGAGLGSAPSTGTQIAGSATRISE